MAETPSSAISAAAAAAASKSAAQSATIAAGNAIKAAEHARASRNDASAGATSASAAAVSAASAAASAATASGFAALATVTPTPNKIPIADGTGKIASGWVDVDVNNITGDVNIDGTVFATRLESTEGAYIAGDVGFENSIFVGGEAELSGRVRTRGELNQREDNTSSGESMSLPAANIFNVQGTDTVHRLTHSFLNGTVIYLRLPAGITVTHDSNTGSGSRIKLASGTDLTTTESYVLPLVFNESPNEWREVGGGAGGGGGITTYSDVNEAQAATSVTPGTLVFIANKGRFYVAVAPADFATPPTVYVDHMFATTDTNTIWVRSDKLSIPFKTHSQFWLTGGQPFNPDPTENATGLASNSPLGIPDFIRRFGDMEDFGMPLSAPGYPFNGQSVAAGLGSVSGNSTAGFANPCTITLPQVNNVTVLRVGGDGIFTAANAVVAPFQIVRWSTAVNALPGVVPAQANSAANADGMVGVAWNGAAAPTNPFQANNVTEMVLIKTVGPSPVLLQSNQVPNGSVGALVYLSATEPGRVTLVAPALPYPVGRVANVTLGDPAGMGDPLTMYVDLFGGPHTQTSALSTDPRFATPSNATATPTASKIPIADGDGKLDDGWLRIRNPMMHFQAQLDLPSAPDGETIVGTWTVPRAPFAANGATNIWARLSLHWSAPVGTAISYGWRINGDDMGETAGGVTTVEAARSNLVIAGIANLGEGTPAMYTSEIFTLQMYIRALNGGGGAPSARYCSITAIGSDPAPAL